MAISTSTEFETLKVIAATELIRTLSVQKLSQEQRHSFGRLTTNGAMKTG